MKKSFSLLLLAFVASFIVSCKSDTTHTETTVTAKTEVIEESVIPAKTLATAEGSFVIDASASSITWSGSKASGDKHNGTIKLKSGTFVVKNGKIAEGQALIDMSTIVNNDQSGKWKIKLENHLKSPEFFDIATHKTSTITIKKATDNGFQANLTIKGIEKPVFIPATISSQGNNLVVDLKTFTIDRTEWGVKYNSGKFFQNLKDRLIKDEIVFGGKIVLTPKG